LPTPAGPGERRPDQIGNPLDRATRAHFALAPGRHRSFLLTLQPISIMQEQVILECTEARKEGKPVSRYLTKRNKKTVTERIEKKKYNPHLKRHTLHKEIK
jgi:large subunit ribosomal protein L33